MTIAVSIIDNNEKRYGPVKRARLGHTLPAVPASAQRHPAPAARESPAAGGKSRAGRAESGKPSRGARRLGDGPRIRQECGMTGPSPAKGRNEHTHGSHASGDPAHAGD